MKKVLALSIVLAAAPVAQAADLEAGKAKVATVCAACHGAAGVSVSDTIPNLAAQRAGYLEAQLKVLKDGTRRCVLCRAAGSRGGRQVHVPAERREDQCDVPGRLQGYVHEVPYDQFPCD
jgi:mono/diheme cytochrome c family protein